MKKILVLTLIFASILSGCEQRNNNMAIQYDGINDYIDFGIPPAISGLGNTITIYGTVSKENSADRFPIFSNQIWAAANAAQVYGISFYLDTSHKLSVSVGGTTSYGGWRYDTALSTDTAYRVAFTMDLSSIANNPVIYVNGVSVAVTEFATPAGTFRPDYTAQTVYLGRMGIPSATDYAKGIQYQTLVYDRILSAAEIADANASRKFIPTHQGLIFCPQLFGASGGVSDGSTLSSSNLITDVVNGARGVPAGGPILLADTLMILE
jgi:hypothetical protein